MGCHRPARGVPAPPTCASLGDVLCTVASAGPLAVLCGWPAGHYGASMVEGLFLWLPLRSLAKEFVALGVESWTSEVLSWRVTRTIVLEALKLDPRKDGRLRVPGRSDSGWTKNSKGGTVMWTMTLPSDQRWTVEDYYVRFILLAIEALHEPGDYRALVDWVYRTSHEEQIFIFYHVLAFFHFQAKMMRWEELSVCKRAWNKATGQKRRLLEH